MPTFGVFEQEFDEIIRTSSEWFLHHKKILFTGFMGLFDLNVTLLVEKSPRA